MLARESVFLLFQKRIPRSKHQNFWRVASNFVILVKSERYRAASPIQGAAPEAKMSVVPNPGNGKITVPELLQRKTSTAGSLSNSKKITCLTAYDYPTARLLDEAGVDVILVGDSLSMVVLGHDSTLPVTLEDMLHHTRAVRRGTRRALVVADMPFGSYHSDTAESLRNAVRFVKEAGAEAVKVEGGERRLELIARLTESEIPVMGHVGLTPQSVNALGGYRVQGKTPDAAEQLLRDARAVEAAGAFAVVLEAVPRELAARITRDLRIPTIGIGAGPDCDGQVLVIHDLLGLTFSQTPKFARQYTHVGEIISSAVRAYCEDVRSGGFPSDAESYHALQLAKEEKEAPVNRDGDW
jgi:3-methyl-2-oxobutanoate hydroxymethyltransferase